MMGGHVTVTPSWTGDVCALERLRRSLTVVVAVVVCPATFSGWRHHVK